MSAAIVQRKFFHLRKARVWPWRRSCMSSSSKSRKWPHCAPRWDKGTTSPTRSSVGSRKMRRRDEKSKASRPSRVSEIENVINFEHSETLCQKSPNYVDFPPKNIMDMQLVIAWKMSQWHFGNFVCKNCLLRNTCTVNLSYSLKWRLLSLYASNVWFPPN